LGRADVYLQPDVGDPVLSTATVVRLARAHVSRAEAVTGVDESGGEARVYLVDEGVVVKTQRPHRVRPLALREGYLDGETPSGDFEAVWTAAMIYADMKAITGGAELAAQASQDVTQRLAAL
jgi:hypothetical protein